MRKLWAEPQNKENVSTIVSIYRTIRLLRLAVKMLRIELNAPLASPQTDRRGLWLPNFTFLPQVWSLCPALAWASSWVATSLRSWSWELASRPSWPWSAAESPCCVSPRCSSWAARASTSEESTSHTPPGEKLWGAERWRGRGLPLKRCFVSNLTETHLSLIRRE